MSIFVHEKEKLFHLTDGHQFSRVLKFVPGVHKREQLIELYYGRALPDDATLHLDSSLFALASFDGINQTSPFVYPVSGHGDFRPVACAVTEENGTQSPCFNFVGYKVAQGKPTLQGLPATYAETNEEATTLWIYLKDEITSLEVTLLFTVFEKLHAHTSTAIYHNAGKQTLRLDKSASCVVNAPQGKEIMHLHGGWARERQVERFTAPRGTFSISSNRGASGHDHNPFVALLDPTTTEFQGEVMGVSLVWSGSHLMEVDLNAFGSLRVVAGIFPCAWQLKAGETFTLPEAVLVYSHEGLNGMSHIFHKLYRTRLCRGVWRDKERPVLINNWEGTYFNFNEEKLLNIAKVGKDMGLELFVLDDGWFGKRNDDHSSLGDWEENLEKLPNGIAGLADKIHDIDMKFGLWYEPEMISPDSNLYRAHPDWCLHAENRERTQARQQLILDLTRGDVQQYLIDSVSTLLSTGKIDYVKWDMNRNFGEVGSAQTSYTHVAQLHVRYMLGLYHVLETIVTRFPNILFESCSGGGGRFDAGMLYYMPQTWTSDDSDAVERLRIQYGTSMVYPIASISAHVSDVPNHITGRSVSMKFRGDVALGGNMGYEMDLSLQTPEDVAEMRAQTQRVKKLRKLMQQGTFSRLVSPFETRNCAWQVSNEDLSELIFFVFQQTVTPAMYPIFVQLQDVDEKAMYQDEEGNVYAGAVLKHKGMRVLFEQGQGTKDCASKVCYLKKYDSVL